MKLIFNKRKHKYTLIKDNGAKVNLVGVTELLRRHKLSPDYTAVDKELLTRKAKRGNVVHEELDKYIKTGEIGFTNELGLFINACKKYQIRPTRSEFMVHNSEVAGTVDFIGVWGEKNLPCIGDFKTTKKLYKESVAWQLSLYAYLITNTVFEKFVCVHFPDAETCNIVEIEPIPVCEIEELLRCERMCELYQKKSLNLTEQEESKIVSIKNALEAIAKQKALLEQQEEELKKFLLQKMQEDKVYQVDNALFKITYVAPFERKSIDLNRLKQEMPTLYEEYQKITTSKPSVRITLKNKE